MSPKSKKVHASKSKSRTVKKGGNWYNPFASWSVFGNKPSTSENTDSQGNPPPIKEPAKVENIQSTVDNLEKKVGGRRRSKKSCKSKKHSKTNKNKCK